MMMCVYCTDTGNAPKNTMALANPTTETETETEADNLPAEGEVEAVDADTIATMYDEPGDGQADGRSRFVAIARTIETSDSDLLPLPQTVVLYADLGANVAVERWFPLPLDWEAVPRSIVVERGRQYKPLTDGLAEKVGDTLDLYDGVEVETDESVDWRVVEGE